VMEDGVLKTKTEQKPEEAAAVEASATATETV